MIVMFLLAYLIFLFAFTKIPPGLDGVGLGILMGGSLISFFSLDPDKRVFDSELASEYEYFLTLPIPRIISIVATFFGFIFTVMAISCAVIWIPLLTLLSLGELPFDLNIFSTFVMLEYCIMFASLGIVLHFITQKSRMDFVLPLVFKTSGAVVMVIFTPSKDISAFLLQLQLKLPVSSINSIKSELLHFTNFLIFPNGWVLMAVKGSIIAFLVLSVTTFYIAKTAYSKLSHYLEEIISNKSRSSYYPSLPSGSKWAVSKFIIVNLIISSKIRLINRESSIVFSVVVFWYFFHLNPQITLLYSLFSISIAIGVPVSRYILALESDLSSCALPILANEFLLGYITAFMLIYAPVIILACLISLHVLTFIGLALAVSGILILALCVYNRYYLLVSFAAMGIIEAAASFLFLK